MSKTHTDREYGAQLDEIGAHLRRMGERVERMVGDAIAALSSGDEAKAREIIVRDGSVDRAEKEIDELCLRTLARWQPMASDLRFVTTALKMVTDLERIGDLAVNIAERAIDLGERTQRWNWEDVARMGERVRGMVHDGTAAFLGVDLDLARDVIERDDEIDELYTAIFREILDAMKHDPDAVRDGIHVQAVAKWLERMADHATNLAEQAIFMSEGKDIRHLDKLPR